MSDQQADRDITYGPRTGADEVQTNVGEHEAPGAAELIAETRAPAAGVGAPEGPNPVVGTPHYTRPEPPPDTIRSLGGAHPGEANPATGHDEDFDSGGPQDTAALLLEREEFEQERAATHPLREPGNVGSAAAYQDQGYPLGDDGDADDKIGGQHVSPDHPDQDHLNVSDEAFLRGNPLLDSQLTRFDAKEEANTLDIQRAESSSGLPYDRSQYEREEMHRPTQPTDLEMVGGMRALPPQTDLDEPVTVMSVFSTPEQAQLAVRGLRQIGIAPDDISVLARQPDGDAGAAEGEADVAVIPRDPGIGSTPAETARMEPAGEQSYRRTSSELPNDEDLPISVAAQAGTEANADLYGGAGATASERGGLARDEGLVARVQAPADPDIYSDFTQSDADYRTEAGEGAAQTGQPNPDVHKVTIVDEGGGRGEHEGHVGAGRGALLGGAFGGLTGLLVGLGALAIPGIGPIVAAGPLAGAITGLLAGSATGGLVGALLDAGVPEEHAGAYAEHLRGGNVIVSVRTDILNRAAVTEVLRAHGAQEVH